MEARLANSHELIEQRQQDIGTYEQRAAATLAENAEIEANLEGLREQVEKRNPKSPRLLEERAGIAAAVEELSNELRILRHQLTECHDQRSRLEVKQSQLEMRATALTEHIQKRYQLDLATFERDLYGLRVAVRDATQAAARGSAAIVRRTAARAPSPEVRDRSRSRPPRPTRSRARVELTPSPSTGTRSTPWSANSTSASTPWAR